MLAGISVRNGVSPRSMSPRAPSRSIRPRKSFRSQQSYIMPVRSRDRRSVGAARHEFSPLVGGPGRLVRRERSGECRQFGRAWNPVGSILTTDEDSDQFPGFVSRQIASIIAGQDVRSQHRANNERFRFDHHFVVDASGRSVYSFFGAGFRQRSWRAFRRQVRCRSVFTLATSSTPSRPSSFRSLFEQYGAVTLGIGLERPGNRAQPRVRVRRDDARRRSPVGDRESRRPGLRRPPADRQRSQAAHAGWRWRRRGRISWRRWRR